MAAAASVFPSEIAVTESIKSRFKEEDDDHDNDCDNNVLVVEDKEDDAGEAGRRFGLRRFFTVSLHLLPVRADTALLFRSSSSSSSNSCLSSSCNWFLIFLSESSSDCKILTRLGY